MSTVASFLIKNRSQMGFHATTLNTYSEINMSDNNANLTQELIQALIQGRKADRRWRNIRFFISVSLFILFILLLSNLWSSDLSEGANYNDPYVALIRLDGEI